MNWPEQPSWLCNWITVNIQIAQTWCQRRLWKAGHHVLSRVNSLEVGRFTCQATYCIVHSVLIIAALTNNCIIWLLLECYQINLNIILHSFQLEMLTIFSQQFPIYNNHIYTTNNDKQCITAGGGYNTNTIQYYVIIPESLCSKH